MKYRSSREKSIVYITTVTCLSFYHTSVLSGGFQLSDHSIIGLGRAHAGYGIVGDDASAPHFNPAGMTLLKERHLQFGFAYHDSQGKLSDNGSNGLNSGDEDDGVQASIVPNIYFTQALSDRLYWGVGLTAPYGTHTDYDADFIGRYNGLKTKISIIDLNPNIAYQVNDHVSVGGGISFQTAKITLSRAIFNGINDGSVDIDSKSDLEYGFNFGTMFTLADHSRLGISYRSGIKHDLKGDATFTNLAPSTAVFDTKSFFESPATVYIGYHKQLTDRLALALGTRWTDWSSLKEIRIQFPNGNLSGGADDVTALSWKDSWTYTIGIDGTINPKWHWRAGLAFDKSPVPDDTRSVRTIDAERHWYAVGGSYIPNKKLQIDFAYRYIDFDKVNISQNTFAGNGSPIGTLNASFNDSNVHSFALQAVYKF